MRVQGKPPLATPVGVMPDKSMEVMATRVRWAHDSMTHRGPRRMFVVVNLVKLIGCWISTGINCEKTVPVI